MYIKTVYGCSISNLRKSSTKIFKWKFRKAFGYE